MSILIENLDSLKEIKMTKKTRPLVTIVIPGYNEEAIVKENLLRVCNYMESLEDNYRWELIFVNDGSTDRTGEIAESFARGRENVHVLHHITNFRLGQALRFAFNYCRGDYIIVMDLDLSYSPDHIKSLLEKITETKAKIVIASPYMKEGKISNVPLVRRILSKWANKYLSFFAQGNISTLTGMVRAYDGRFLRSLNLRSMDSEINEEIIYKAQMLNARILEIPAHLDWSLQRAIGKSRKSSLKIISKILSCLFSGFIFRPFLFFILPGFMLVTLSLYPFYWAFVHTINELEKVPPSVEFFGSRLSGAIAAAFQISPHSFLVGGFTLMLGLQIISLGVIAYQSKRYFEELFHLGSSIYKYNRENGE